MAGRSDIESFLDDVKALLATQLNVQIDEVNTDKADTITLKEVDPVDGYFFQALNTGTPNVDPFVLYGIETPVADSTGPSTAVKYDLFVVVVIADPGQDLDIFRRLLRYQRALMQLFASSWASQMLNNQRYKISGLNPFPLSLVGMENAMAVGVSLSLTMG